MPSFTSQVGANTGVQGAANRNSLLEQLRQHQLAQQNRFGVIKPQPRSQSPTQAKARFPGHTNANIRATRAAAPQPAYTQTPNSSFNSPSQPPASNQVDIKTSIPYESPYPADLTRLGINQQHAAYSQYTPDYFLGQQNRPGISQNSRALQSQALPQYASAFSQASQVAPFLTFQDAQRNAQHQLAQQQAREGQALAGANQALTWQAQDYSRQNQGLNFLTSILSQLI